MFNGIQQLQKSYETEQMQLWLCLKKLQACIKESRSRSIIHYSILPHVWPIKYGTNLIQVVVDDFEANGFLLCGSLMELPSIQIGLLSEEIF